MEGQVYSYQSLLDEEILEYASEEDLPRKRGTARSWSFVKIHVNLQAGFKCMRDLNIPTMTRLKGRNNRGKTASYYYYCVKKSCSCTKEWRLVTALDSLLVTEEETSEDHVLREMYTKNGGRGSSFEQVKIVDESFRLGIKKPKFVIKFFERQALLNPNGMLQMSFNQKHALIQLSLSLS